MVQDGGKESVNPGVFRGPGGFLSGDFFFGYLCGYGRKYIVTRLFFRCLLPQTVAVEHHIVQLFKLEQILLSQEKPEWH